MLNDEYFHLFLSSLNFDHFDFKFQNNMSTAINRPATVAIEEYIRDFFYNYKKIFYPAKYFRTLPLDIGQVYSNRFSFSLAVRNFVD